MQAANRGMCIPGPASTVLFKHLRQAICVLGQVLERHGTVLNE